MLNLFIGIASKTIISPIYKLVNWSIDSPEHYYYTIESDTD